MTITLNASVDTYYRLEALTIGAITRTANPVRTAGGKGLNVARVLKQLGIDVTATGFVGGRNGDFIRAELRKAGIKDEFIEIEGETRQCLAFMDRLKNQTEILEEGPLISEEEQFLFKKEVGPLLERSEVVSISGSLPKGTSPEMYQWIIEEARKRGKRVLLDTSGKALVHCLPYAPFLVKPNMEELEKLIGRECARDEDVWAAMEQIAENGIQVVIVSNGGKGSFVLHNGERLKVSPPKIEAVSSVGSGDAFVAGFAAGLIYGKSIGECVALATACGTANALEEKTGCIQPELVDGLLEKVNVEHV